MLMSVKSDGDDGRVPVTVMMVEGDSEGEK